MSNTKRKDGKNSLKLVGANSGSNNNGGEPPMSNLEKRVMKVELGLEQVKTSVDDLTKRVDRLDTRLDKIDEHLKEIDFTLVKINTKLDDSDKIYATKAELHNAIHTQTKWLMATMITLVGLTLAAVKYLI